MPLCFIDIEATSPKEASKREIIEIGLSIFTRGKQISEDAIFIKPIYEFPLSEHTKKYCNVQDINLINAGDIGDAIMNVHGALRRVVPHPYKLEEHVVYIAWGNQDLPWLNSAITSQGFAPFMTKENHLNVMGMYHALWPKTQKHNSLEKAVNSYGIEFNGIKHTAMADAVNLNLLFMAMVKDNPKACANYIKGSTMSIKHRQIIAQEAEYIWHV